jgi:pimeloyl-ACP methyl ester carboxylesterase
MTKQIIEVGQYTAAYTSIGEGIPVILLHGFFGDAWTLDPIAKGLAKNHCCISLELLGFGDSSKPDIRYLIGDHVEFLRGFTTAKQISEFYLVGYSYGAWVAAAYAATINDQQIPTSSKLNSMVLLAPAGIRDDTFVGRYNFLKPLLWQTPLVDLVLDAIDPIAKLLKYEYFSTIRMARTAISTQPAARSFLIDRLNPEDAVDTVENDIDRITIPTLVIAGEIDGTIPFWHSQTYADKIPKASLVVVAGADHDLVQTHADEVTRSILEHWNR